MNGPRITDAAKSAAKEALRGYTGDCICHEAFRTRGRIDPTCWPCGLSGAHEDILTAALPHIERAVIQRLIEKAEADEQNLYRDEMGDVSDWLRAELEGGGE